MNNQLIGSFKRTGNYPLEADYIFNTKQDLDNFYKDPINKTTMHEGLMRVVTNGSSNKQELYWVVNNNGNLEFSKFSSDNSDIPEDILKILNWNEV